MVTWITLNYNWWQKNYYYYFIFKFKQHKKAINPNFVYYRQSALKTVSARHQAVETFALLGWEIVDRYLSRFFVCYFFTMVILRFWVWFNGFVWFYACAVLGRTVSRSSFKSERLSAHRTLHWWSVVSMTSSCHVFCAILSVDKPTNEIKLCLWSEGHSGKCFENVLNYGLAPRQ